MDTITYNGKQYKKADRQVQETLAASEIYIVRYYPKDRVMICSDVAVERLHCKKVYDQMPQSALDELIAEADVTRARELFERIDSGEKRVVANLRNRVRNEIIRVSFIAMEFDENGDTLSSVGFLEKQNEEITSADLVRALSDDYHSVYFVDFIRNTATPYRLSNVIVREYGEDFWSASPYDQVMQTYVSRTVVPEDREEMLQILSYDYLQEFFKTNHVLHHDYRVMRDGRIQYYRTKIVDISPEGSFTRAIYGFADVDTEKTRELERYAYIDPVTGGENYIRFKKYLSEKDGPGVIVSVDIHSFKVVNSICGTVKGDEILREVWRCIADSLGADDLAAHINADHYVIYYACTDLEEIRGRLDALTDRMVKRSVELGVPQQVPYFGVSTWTNDKKIEQTYNEATIARHEVKYREDVNLAFFKQEAAAKILREKQMVDAFDSSIREKRFEIWYQPKFNPHNNRLVGAEALVRWREKDGGLVSPGTFIPLFEKNGLIRYLDEYVFRTVCTQQKKWQMQGYPMHPISVNLSRASLYYQNVVERYHAIVTEIGIAPALVPIEITETAAVDSEAIDRLAERFCDAGFPLHIDDFGAGYSSLAVLNTLHYDTLKLDKSLIDYIGNYSGDKLLEHTVALAKELGMHVTAEGVETGEQVKFLQQLSCDSIQGFYYSKPLPLEDFEAVVKDQTN